MSVTGAELLNEKFEAMSDRFDRLKSVPEKQAKLINAAISSWQDFYWNEDNYMNHAWPQDKLIQWQDVYVKTAKLLDELTKQTVVVKSFKETDSYKQTHREATPAQVVHLPPLLITAKPPAPPPPPPPPPPLTGIGRVNLKGWSDVTSLSGNPYRVSYKSRTWEAPVLPQVKENRSGLLALTLGIVTSIVGTRQGWL